MSEREGSFDSMFQSGATNVKLVYVLFLLSPLLGGVTTLVGLIMAIMNRGGGPEWTTAHYTYQIRTVWVGILYGVLAGILMIVGIGFLLLLLVGVWYIVRCVRGLQFSGREEALPDPETWLW